MPMIALPSRSLTDAISPTSTPAMLTVWPWPGVTAWAVVISASITKKSLPTSGTHAGSASRCLPRITRRHRGRDDQQADDRQEVRQVLADRRPHLAFSAAGSAFLAVPNGFSLRRTAARSASRRSLSRTDLTWAVSAAEPVGADFAAAGPLTSGIFCL